MPGTGDGQRTLVTRTCPLLSPATIRDAVFLMSSLYKAAMRENPPLVTVNPFSDLELPEREPHAIDFYEHDEAAAVFAAIEATAGWRGGHSPSWR